ncbi:MAG: hypothetical protein A4E72_02165 [Syntrophus sp. PtaU1.Bin208]|nr:MAG: hypothetical protein A4E72_02165 [Syntrophus sp. PtaU1.Bin208]
MVKRAVAEGRLYSLNDGAAPCKLFFRESGPTSKTYFFW